MNIARFGLRGEARTGKRDYSCVPGEQVCEDGGPATWLNPAARLLTLRANHGKFVGLASRGYLPNIGCSRKQIT